MPTNRLAPKLTHNGFTPTYMGAPIEELEQTMATLDKRYKENQAAMDVLESTINKANIDEKYAHHRTDALNRLKGTYDEIMESGEFENSSQLVRGSIKGLENDVLFHGAVDETAKLQAWVEKQKARIGAEENDITDDMFRKQYFAIREQAQDLTPDIDSDGNVIGYQGGFNTRDIPSVYYTTKEADAFLADWEPDEGIPIDGTENMFIVKGEDGNFYRSTRYAREDGNFYYNLTSEAVAHEELYSSVKSYVLNDPKAKAYFAFEAQFEQPDEIITTDQVNAMVDDLKLVGWSQERLDNYLRNNSVEDLWRTHSLELKIHDAILPAVNKHAYTRDKYTSLNMDWDDKVSYNSGRGIGSTDYEKAIYVAGTGDGITNPNGYGFSVPEINGQITLDEDKITLLQSEIAQLQGELSNIDAGRFNDAGTGDDGRGMVERRKELQQQIEDKNLNIRRLQNHSNDLNVLLRLTEVNVENHLSDKERTALNKFGDYETTEGQYYVALTAMEQGMNEYLAKNGITGKDATASSDLIELLKTERLPIKTNEHGSGNYYTIEGYNDSFGGGLIDTKGGEVNRLTGVLQKAIDGGFISQTTIDQFEEFNTYLKDDEFRGAYQQLGTAHTEALEDYLKKNEYMPTFVDLTLGYGENDTETKYSADSKFKTVTNSAYTNNTLGFKFLDKANGAEFLTYDKNPNPDNFTITGMTLQPVGEYGHMMTGVEKHYDDDGNYTHSEVHYLTATDPEIAQQYRKFAIDHLLSGSVVGHPKGYDAQTIARSMSDTYVDEQLTAFQTHNIQIPPHGETNRISTNVLLHDGSDAEVQRETDHLGDTRFQIKYRDNNNKPIVGTFSSLADVEATLEEINSDLIDSHYSVATVGPRTERHNNPLAFAIGDVDGNEFTRALDAQGILWTKGDKFTGDDGKTYYTIRISGNSEQGRLGSMAVLKNTNAIKNWYANKSAYGNGADILLNAGVTDAASFNALPEEKQWELLDQLHNFEKGPNE